MINVTKELQRLGKCLDNFPGEVTGKRLALQDEVLEEEDEEDACQDCGTPSRRGGRRGRGRGGGGLDLMRNWDTGGSRR